MSLNAAMIQVMVDKGLSAQDIADIARAGEAKIDRTGAERQARHRAKRNAVTSRRDPPIEDNHTPGSDDLPGGKSQNAAWRKPAFCESDQVWADFLKNRKRKRLPNTETAYAGFLADIHRLADDEWPPGKLLTHAVRKGWGGIYDPREPRNDRQHPSVSKPTTREIGERVAARFASGGNGDPVLVPRLGAASGNDRR